MNYPYNQVHVIAFQSMIAIQSEHAFLIFFQFYLTFHRIVIIFIQKNFNFLFII